MISVVKQNIESIGKTNEFDWTMAEEIASWVMSISGSNTELAVLMPPSSGEGGLWVDTIATV